jgi:predicted nucleic acid-binding protein
VTLRYLLDTSTLSALVAATPNPLVFARLTEREAQCAIAAPVWSELVYAYERLDIGKRKAVLEGFVADVVLKLFPILPFDQDAASWLALERARQERARRVTAHVDGQIAAIASVHDLTVVTASPRDFAHFKGVRVEDWSRPKKKAAPRAK